MGCTECGEKVFARKLCQKHYWRWRRGGTFERQRGVNTEWCTKEGCKKRAHAKTLCSQHYQQSLGPMRTLWGNLRSRSPGEYPPEWDDMSAFITAVGERPGDKYQLRRPNPLQPWGPDNFAWHPPVRHSGGTGLTADMAVYQLAWKYLRQFGLTDEDIKRMEAEQNGLCPICTLPLRRINPDTGKPIKVCLDHDHNTGVARSLVDDACNKGLGSFRDDPVVLRRAADYIEFHTSKERKQ